jgi:hypothetical protein
MQIALSRVASDWRLRTAGGVKHVLMMGREKEEGAPPPPHCRFLEPHVRWCCLSPPPPPGGVAERKWKVELSA